MSNVQVLQLPAYIEQAVCGHWDVKDLTGRTEEQAAEQACGLGKGDEKIF
jgi:hypothetical protein